MKIKVAENKILHYLQTVYSLIFLGLRPMLFLIETSTLPFAN